MVEHLFIHIEEFLRQYSAWSLPASFLGGVLVSVSPCILPILPITLSIIGEAALNSKSKTLMLSIIFVLGITVTYVSLGITAAVFGIFIGRIIKSYVIYLGLGVIFIIIGLSFFDTFRIPVFSINYRPKVNLVSIFVLGVITGFSMIPCAFPVLGTILGIVSLRSNLLYGIACLMFFSAGYGFVLFCVGMSAGFMKRLSKNHFWSIIVKRILGAVVLLMGLYFILNTLRIML